MDRIISKSNGRYERAGIKIVRYCDDFVIMGEKISKEVLDDVSRIINILGLILNQDKTKLVRATEDSFDFLGYTMRYSKSRYDKSKKYWSVIPSKKSEKGIRQKLSEYMSSHRNIKTECFVKGLNEKLRGWTNYFKITNVSNTSKSFNSLSYYIAIMLERYFKRKSQRRCKLGNQKAYKILVNNFGLIDISKSRNLTPVNV